MLKRLRQFSSTGLEHSWTHPVWSGCFGGAKSPQLSVDLLCSDMVGGRGELSTEEEEEEAADGVEEV